jgi:flavin-binding protein dodecin
VTDAGTAADRVDAAQKDGAGTACANHEIRTRLPNADSVSTAGLNPQTGFASNLCREVPEECRIVSDPVYKKIEVIGTSTSSIEEAINNAIARAGQTVHGLRWFEVAELRGDIKDSKVSHWQATVRIGFRIDD